MWTTPDLCDQHGDAVDVLAPILRSFGGVHQFSGRVATVRVVDDNVLVRAALEESGEGRVLVVDGGGSTTCALLGDRLASIAAANGWAGVIVHGCIRDAEALATVPVGVLAVATHPRRSEKHGVGERDVAVAFGGATFRPGMVVYVDPDGVIVSERTLV